MFPINPKPKTTPNVQAHKTATSAILETSGFNRGDTAFDEGAPSSVPSQQHLWLKENSDFNVIGFGSGFRGLEFRVYRGHIE